MNIYVKNINTSNVYQTSTTEGVNTFVIENLPAGEYIAYAYTQEKLFGDEHEANKEKGSGGYSHAVPCGLRIDCENHDLILIKLEDGASIDSIQICDWYGAVVPEE
jgi:hypothetical protein